MTSERGPIACTLAATAAADQVLEWADLQGQATSVDPLPTGARMRFPAELAPLLADLAAREAACCAFLDISTVVTDGEAVVEVTSPDPDARPVISLLAGVPLS